MHWGVVRRDVCLWCCAGWWAWPLSFFALQLTPLLSFPVLCECRLQALKQLRARMEAQEKSAQFCRERAKELQGTYVVAACCGYGHGDRASVVAVWVLGHDGMGDIEWFN